MRRSLPFSNYCSYFFMPSFAMPSLDIASSFFMPSLDIVSLDMVSLAIPSLPILSCAKAAGEARPTERTRAEIESSVRKVLVMLCTLCFALLAASRHFDYVVHSNFVTHCDL